MSLSEERRTQIITNAKSYVGVSRSHRVEDLNRITEGRYAYKSPKYGWYAWCGDYVTFMLELEGCRDPTALNRTSVAGRWTPGDNINRLFRWAKAHGMWCASVFEAKSGDIIIRPAPNGDHIFIVDDITDDGYGTIDGNGHMGAVSLGHRSFSAPVRGVIKIDTLVGTNKSETAPGGVPRDQLPKQDQNPDWTPIAAVILPIAAAFGLPVTVADSPFSDTDDPGIDRDERGVC